jgi:hypothetical protein
VIFSRRREDAGRRAAPAIPSTGSPTRVPPPVFGPYDVTQAPEDDQARLDLGALRLPAVPGVEIQLQAGPQGQIQQVLLAHEASRLQLGVYAAPRTQGIWDEIRAEMLASLAQGGGRPREVDGEYGTEVRAQLRDSGGGVLDVRHVGIDGPRWFVHGIFIGAAAIDPDRSGPLRDVLHGLVVDRGTEARPVREALPMRLPPEAAAQLADATGDGETQ